MTDKHLHIVTHEIPYPVKHGGLVDIFYKIVSLYEKGVIIHLHCFKKYGEAEEEELNKYCKSVSYYPRKIGLKSLSISTPYIVNSRKSDDLLNLLSRDKHPILLEGFHCTYLLKADTLRSRKILVRMHNIESLYYERLASCEKNILRKIYYYAEAKLLFNYEHWIAKKASFVTVSESDAERYRSSSGAECYFVPAFTPYNEVSTLNAKGYFCLYHGNLSVNENVAAVRWLLTEVFNKLEVPLVIAGRNPSPGLVSFCERRSATCVIANPTEEEMQDVIQKAQVNILPSFNNTGVKLKLLNALYNGKHCLVNKAAVAGSGLEILCNVAEGKADFISKIKTLYELPVTQEQILLRESVLQEMYNNEKNAEKLMTLIW